MVGLQSASSVLRLLRAARLTHPHCMMRRRGLPCYEVQPDMQETNPLEKVFPTHPGVAWQRRYDATRTALDSPARLGGYLRAIAALGVESEPAGTVIYAPKWMTAN